MPYSIAKAILEKKDDTTIASYVTAAPVAPAAGDVMIYVDLIDGQLYRKVEIASRVKELAARMREENYSRPLIADAFWSIPIGGAKGSIVQGATSAGVVDGTISIGVDATIVAGTNGSILIDSCIEQMMQYLRENGFS
jgi:hypothetical protein